MSYLFVFGFILFQEEQRRQAKVNREKLCQVLEEHEEIHSQVRWRRVCDIFENDPLWKSITPEDRKVGAILLCMNFTVMILNDKLFGN